MRIYHRMNLLSTIRYVGVLGLLWAFLFFLASSPSAHSQGSKLRVALFVDDGAVPSEFKKEFRRSNDDTFTWQDVDGDDIRGGALKDFDALVVPGGSASAEASSMGAEARENVRRFVKEGGVYMGVCAGAYLSSRQKDLDLGFLPLKTLDPEHWYRVDDGTLVDVELTPTGMEVFGISKSNIRVIYENGPIFGPPIEQPDPSFTPLGFFRSEVVADGGERGVMRGAPAIILSRYGQGIVLAISPHFEETPGLKQVQLHALHWLYDHRLTGATSSKASQETAPKTAPGITAGSTPRTTGGASPIARTSAVPSTLASAATSAPNSALTPSPTFSRTPAYSDNLSLGEKALQLAQAIFEKASVVRYIHKEVPAARQVITEDDGTVESKTDCSGFISYLVHTVAPAHYQIVRSREPQASYPQAKIWARFFDSLDTNQPQDGWLQISDWKNLNPGDFIAWKEGGSSSGNTGHVMMVLRKPNGVQQRNNLRYIEVQVIDSSSVYHFPPEYLPPHASMEHRNGLGIGSIRIILSQNDQPIGYWEGTYWGEGDKPVRGPTQSNMIRFGRMVPMETVMNHGIPPGLNQGI